MDTAPTNNAPSTFTAAQVARAAGFTWKSVAGQLRDVPPTGSLLVNQRPTPTWSFEPLPDILRRRLCEVAKARGYRDAEHLLSQPEQPWQPRIPVDQVAKRHVDRAIALRQALKPSLARWNDLSLTRAELLRLGMRDYQQVFGHAISGVHFERIIDRTIDRDAGAGDLDRLEIYLDDRLALKPELRPVTSIVAEDEFRELNAAYTGYTDPGNPTPKEKEFGWLRAFEIFEEQLDAGKARKRLKRRLLAFLWKHAPWMAKSPNALRVNFDRKYSAWVASGRNVASLADGRADKPKFELPQEALDPIIAKAVLETGGRVSQAFRELRNQGTLAGAIAGRYLTNPASKSYVPAKIRAIAQPEARRLYDYHHGPRQHTLNGAHVDRDWSGVYSGDWYQGDDLTAPIYYHDIDDTGRPDLIRGQVLVLIDLRSTFILNFCLISERTYNAHVIRTLITKACDLHGFPRRGFYFERGIWESSKLLKGKSEVPFSSGEIEMGLREFGLEFRHANLPRTKPIERVLGAIQNLMESHPGYVGRNEQVEELERVQKRKLEVQRGADPSQHFYSADEWTQALTRVCADYNAEAQDGKMTEGLSPEDAFHQFNNLQDPQIRLPAECRYLLAHHKRPVKVTGNGVPLRFGKQVFNYRSAETGPLVGQTVLAWFNPEVPEFLTITDMDRKSPIVIARAESVPAMDATPEQMEKAMHQIGSHQKYARARYQELKSKYFRPFRGNLVAPQVIETGRIIEAKTEALRQEEKSILQGVRSVGKINAEFGVRLDPDQARKPEAFGELERLRQLLTKKPDPSDSDHTQAS